MTAKNVIYFTAQDLDFSVEGCWLADIRHEFWHMRKNIELSEHTSFAKIANGKILNVRYPRYNIEADIFRGVIGPGIERIHDIWELLQRPEKSLNDDELRRLNQARDLVYENFMPYFSKAEPSNIQSPFFERKAAKAKCPSDAKSRALAYFCDYYLEPVIPLAARWVNGLAKCADELDAVIQEMPRELRQLFFPEREQFYLDGQHTCAAIPAPAVTACHRLSP